MLLLRPDLVPGQSQSWPTRNSGVNTTAGAGERVIATAQITVSAPAAPVADSTCFCADASAFAVSVTGNGNNIDGSASAVAVPAGTVAVFMFSGGEWKRVVPQYQDEDTGGLVLPTRNLPVPTPGWTTAVDLSFAGIANPGLGVDGTYTLAGIAGVKRENAANDRVAMTINANGIVFSPNVGSYNPGTTRTAPLLWFPLSSLGLPSTLDWSSSLRILMRVASSTQAVDNPGHHIVAGIDGDDTPGLYSMYAKHGTNGFSVRQISAGLLAGTAIVNNQNMGVGIYAADFVLQAEIPALLKASPEVLASWRDGVAAWPDVTTLAPAAGDGMANAQPLNTINPTNLAVINRLGIVLACESNNGPDQYVVTVSNLRVDYKL